MATFRARVSFAGLQALEVERLNRMMDRLHATVGKTALDPNSPGGDTPTSRMYLFPPVEVETVTEFTAWLQAHIRQEIQTPVEFTVEKIDEDTGLVIAD
jgi:hypothetical protein